MPHSPESPTKIEKMEYKIFPFSIQETKASLYDNKGIGIIKGYAATYGNVDRVNDVILEGAFDGSIQDYKNQNRMLKVYYQHDTFNVPIGGIRPENLNSDKKGLLVAIDVNTKVQLGNDVYELAKQGVLSDMSISFTVEEDGSTYTREERCLKKLKLWEVSIVGEPANEDANVTEVKHAAKQKFYNVTDLKSILFTKKDYENILRESGAFSKEAAIFLAARFIEKARSESDVPTDTKEKNNLIHLHELKTLLTKL